jgi:hypothetical protein
MMSSAIFFETVDMIHSPLVNPATPPGVSSLPTHQAERYLPLEKGESQDFQFISLRKGFTGKDEFA